MPGRLQVEGSSNERGSADSDSGEMPKMHGRMGEWARGGIEFLASNGVNRPMLLRCDCRRLCARYGQASVRRGSPFRPFLDDTAGRSAKDRSWIDAPSSRSITVSYWTLSHALFTIRYA